MVWHFKLVSITHQTIYPCSKSRSPWHIKFQLTEKLLHYWKSAKYDCIEVHTLCAYSTHYMNYPAVRFKSLGILITPTRGGSRTSRGKGRQPYLFLIFFGKTLQTCKQWRIQNFSKMDVNPRGGEPVFYLVQVGHG